VTAADREKISKLITELGVYSTGTDHAPLDDQHIIVIFYKDIFYPYDGFPTVKLPGIVADCWVKLNDAVRDKNRSARYPAVDLADELQKMVNLGDYTWFDDNARTLIIDGNSFKNVERYAYALFRILAAIGDRSITSEQIFRTLKTGLIPTDLIAGESVKVPFVTSLLSPGDKLTAVEKRFDSALKELCRELRDYIISAGRKGRRLKRPG
jgi:hypothetical protein